MTIFSLSGSMADFPVLLQKSSQLEIGTTEQSSQTSKSGGLEHNNELQKVNLRYFSKAAVNSGSSGWEGSFANLREEHGFLSMMMFLMVYLYVMMVVIVEHQDYASKNESVVFAKQD